MRYIFTFLLLFMAMTPQVSLAQGSGTADDPIVLPEVTIDTGGEAAPEEVSVEVTREETSAAGGFVQCSGADCDFCDLVRMAQSIMTFLLQIATVISVIVIAVAGIRLVVSRGNSSALGEAKKQLLNILIGIAIVMFAFTIVDVFLKVLIGGDFGVWNEIESDKCGGENLVGSASSGRVVGGHEVDALFDITDDPDVGYSAELGSGPDDGLRGGSPTVGTLKEFAGYKFDDSIYSKVEYMAKEFGLRVTSGYRSKEKNTAVGGSPTSYHLYGRAADFVGTAEQMREAENWAKSQGAKEAFVHNVKTGTHLHVAW